MTPAPDTATPALPDRAEAWAAHLAAVPGAAAVWAAQFHRALVAPRGTCGETGDAWVYDPDRRSWMRHDGYDLTPDPGPPDDLEVVDWPGQGHCAAELDTRLGAYAERQYLALAAQAAEAGELAAFRAAVTALPACELAAGLRARLTGRTAS